MSFYLTTLQVLLMEKTVTRRFKSWARLREGSRILAIQKGQGLSPGEKQKPLRIIQIESVIDEPLSAIKARPDDMAAEGFPEMSAEEFIEFFCNSHSGCDSESKVRRIEFSYVDRTEVNAAIDELWQTYYDRSLRARKTASAAYRKGDKVKHQKFCAVARCWEMAAKDMLVVNLPF